MSRQGRREILDSNQHLSFLSLLLFHLRSALSRLTRERKKRRSKEEAIETGKGRGYKGEVGQRAKGNGRNVTRERIVECVVTRVFRANKKALLPPRLFSDSRTNAPLNPKRNLKAGRERRLRMQSASRAPPRFLLPSIDRREYSTLFPSASSPRDFRGKFDRAASLPPVTRSCLIFFAWKETLDKFMRN